MTYPVLSIANKILAAGASQTDDGELISNLKLQKLLYYMQGFHIAVFDEPLFDAEIEAWMYGPVVPCVYDRYKGYGNGGIKPRGGVIALTPEEENLFNEVLRVYGKYSAIGLMEFTHKEMPWTTTPTGMGNVIQKAKLKTFFKKRVK